MSRCLDFCPVVRPVITEASKNAANQSPFWLVDLVQDQLAVYMLRRISETAHFVNWAVSWRKIIYKLRRPRQ